MRIDKLDPRVWDLVVGIFSDDDNVRDVYATSQELRRDVADEGRLDAVNRQIKRLQTRLVRLRDVYLDGDISRQDYQAERNRHRADLDRWRNEVESLAKPDTLIAPETFAEFAVAVRDSIAGVTSFKKRLWIVETLDIEVVLCEDRTAVVTALGIRLGEVPCD